MEKNYDFTIIEKQMQGFWAREEIYRFDPKAGGALYSIDTPPPTVSGSLHIGHIFSYTQAEMIARFRRMQGCNVFYPFGFDDNGLPTERLVERDEGIIAKDLPRSEFIEKCLGTTEKYEREFRELWQSLGFSADWNLQYTTISPEVRKISQALFLELIKMGKAYCKESPVLWCTECKTSIAQAELDTKDVDSAFNYLPFACGDEVIEVATTRPELLFGCVCLFVNPEDKRYARFVGKNVRVPLYDYEIPVMTDEKVGIDKGTGAVMCATFGDSTDAEWARQYELPYRKVITPDGRINENVPFIGGMRIKTARKEIIRLLAEKGLLLKSEDITHTVAVHERCGTETEIIPSRQWYIDVLSGKERFLKAADELNWYPGSMKGRYVDWVSNLKWDWCISRQRYFGIPFPVWYCEHCGKPVFATPEQLPVNPLETPYQGKCECGCEEFIPESAVLDTWATSSVTPQINERHGISLVPMAMRAQAHEIIRTWTFYTVVRSLYHTGKLPWKDVMISGFVLAKKGEKISKSKANSELAPANLIAQHSADAMRYWAASAKLGTDTFFSPDDLAEAKRFLTKLWNASKFSISHLQDIDLSETPELLPVDRWILARTGETVEKARQYLYEYEIGSARHEIDELFWKDFCDNYIEIVKDRLYQPDIHGEEERRSGQYALYHALLSILKLYAPYVPHITEAIYLDFFRQHEGVKSIHLLKWEQSVKTDAEILMFGESLKKSVAEVRKYKSEHNLSMRTEIGEMVVSAPETLLPFFKMSEKDLLACSRAGKIICRAEES
ncbi:MAG TPA: valine--tRNA ligase [Clostridiales bacterium]|nr:valine--tRNA ligase [Clostridiales bacterium]